MDWDQLYIKHPEFCIKEIAKEVEEVFPLIEAMPGEAGDKRIYDLGFGAGRHILFFAERGYQVFGDDISKSGKAITEELLAEKGLKSKLGTSDMTVIPYQNNYFDAIINRGVITHNTINNIETCIAEMYRTLRPEGIVMTTFISTESSEYAKGTEIEHNTFIADSGPEEGVAHHFVNEAETEALMAQFKKIRLYHFKHEGILNIGNYISAHWIYIGKKPNTIKEV